MKIHLLTGSPHANGTSAFLAQRFTEGARQSGHTVTRFDAGLVDIAPCRDCNECASTGACVLDGAMNECIDQILGADMLVIVTPVYYFSISGQIDRAIERLRPRLSDIVAKHMDSALLTTAWNPGVETTRGVEDFYDCFCARMNFTDRGRVLGLSCGDLSMEAATSYPDDAYNMGLGL